MEQTNQQASEQSNTDATSPETVEDRPLDLIANKEKDSLASLLAKLTVRNRLFITLLADGVKTADAYKMAGYKGEPHAAYELRSYLNAVLEKYLAARGFDRTTLMGAMNELVGIPIAESEKKATTVKMRLAILKEFNKMIPAAESKGEQKKITAIQINIANGKAEAPPVESVEVQGEEVQE